jgi:hypothetical protein
MTKRKRTNKDMYKMLHRKLNMEQHEPHKTWGELRCSVWVNCFCSTMFIWLKVKTIIWILKLFENWHDNICTWTNRESFSFYMIYIILGILLVSLISDTNPATLVNLVTDCDNYKPHHRVKSQLPWKTSSLTVRN